MVMLNDLDRFHLVDRRDRPGAGPRVAGGPRPAADGRQAASRRGRTPGSRARTRRRSRTGRGRRREALILVVNAGSSSLKLRLLDPADAVVETADLPAVRGSEDGGSIAEAIAGLGGGRRRSGTGSSTAGRGSPRRSRSTTRPSRASRRSSPLAPLHQPRSLAGIAAVRAALPGRPARRLLRHGLPRHAARRSASTYAIPARVARAGHPAVRVPRAVARLRLGARGGPVRARGRRRVPGRHLPPRCWRVAGGRARRPVGGHDDGLHAARGARDGDALRDDRPGDRHLARHGAGRPVAAEVADGAGAPVGAAGARRDGGHARRSSRGAATGDAGAMLALGVYVHRLRGVDRRDDGVARRARRARVHRRRRGAIAPGPRRWPRPGSAFLGVALDDGANEARRRRADAEIGAAAPRCGRSSSPPARTSRSPARSAALGGGRRAAARHAVRSCAGVRARAPPFGLTYRRARSWPGRAARCTATSRRPPVPRTCEGRPNSPIVIAFKEGEPRRLQLSGRSHAPARSGAPCPRT